jgi:hypothetical protein
MGSFAYWLLKGSLVAIAAWLAASMLAVVLRLIWQATESYAQVVRSWLVAMRGISGAAKPHYIITGEQVLRIEPTVFPVLSCSATISDQKLTFNRKRPRIHYGVPAPRDAHGQIAVTRPDA